ncbi:hypothetical protein QN277_012159 [Acacia crassicarpa]|uniref:ADP-ribosyl cyclase/cyclic ADP-ribose hydrolase n=1 Tax=Acacia crassicarpa TaxID=499986 RepID=A0AAE1N135_9FABA|nr:hypothetical protein QN277_012159 [Acacia crassicarpa]
MVTLNAQHLPKEDLKVKRVMLPSRWTYDVFLSYRGDGEYSSFVYLLFNSLCQMGIHVFMNDELVKTSGEQLKEIKESRTAIIVISKNYVSSPSCLNSLAIIYECCRMDCRFMYPIFYDVEPLELQHQMGSYGEVFARLKKIFKQHVQKWRLALFEVVALSEVGGSRGFRHLNPNKNAIEDEYIVKTIIAEVFARIDRFPLPVGKYSVALESQVQEVISVVDVGSNVEVKMVGICAIRKSAIARAVCNVIARHFEDLWYFSSVSSSSTLPWTKDDVSYPIKMKLPVYEIARGYGFTLDDFHYLIRQPWFSQKKILVILDGVEVMDQLGAIRECDRFGEGSRIIVVTKDKQFLVTHGVEIIYDDEWNSALSEKGKNPKEEEDLKAKRAELPSGWTYDVLLSYREDDECSSFVSCLYNSLCQRGVRAFVNEALETSRENLKAIQKSRTTIIVISKNYASSPCCLNSLAIIHEYFRMECRFIYPIFYDVNPLELQHQTGSYGDVFARLGKKFKHDVQKWRVILSEVVDLRGKINLSSRYLLTLL